MKRSQVMAALTIGMVVVSMFLLLPSCHKEKKAEQLTPVPGLTVFSRSSDPRLAEAPVEDGYYVDFLATKDQQANPTSLTAISVHKADFSDESTIILHNDQVQRISLADGTQLVINSATATAYNITLTTGDGSYQLNTELATSAATKVYNTVAPLGIAARGGVKLVKAANPTVNKLSAMSTAAVGGMAGVEIDVTKCGGIPADADAVYLNVYRNQSGNSLKLLPKIPAFHSGTGLYFAAVPIGISTDYVVSSKDACKFALDAAQEIKEHGEAGFYSVLAKLLLNGATAVTVNSAEVPQSVPEYLKKFSDILNKAESATDKYAAIKDAACDKITLKDDIHNYGGLKMQAEAQAPGNGEPKLSALIENVPSDGPYAALKVELGASPTVSTIDLAPSHPAVYQSYMATARLMCLPVGTQVQIGIVGTDGYSNIYQATVSALDDSDPYVLTLQVPGASSAGIKDIITVTLKTPASQVATKSTYLIFGE